MTGTLPALADRPLPGAGVTLPRRRAALAELAAAGWPQKRRERWRYTDLEPLSQAGYELAAPPGDAELRDAAARIASLSGTDPRLVLVDGHFSRGLSGALPPGVEALDLDAEWDEFDGRWAGNIATSDHPLAALNTAFNQQGLYLKIAAGHAPRRLHILHLGSLVEHELGLGHGNLLQGSTGLARR